MSKGDELGIVASGAGMAANFFIVVACGAWLAGTPLPGLNVAGLVLIGTSTVVAVVSDEIERSKTRASHVGLQLVHHVRNNPFYAAMTPSEGGDDSIAGKLALIAKACEEGHRPPPPNNDFVLRALADAGFDRETIVAIVDHSTAPIFPGSLPAPG